MPIGVVFIFLALIFYTISIWSERISHRLVLWMVLVLGVAFLCDLTGTTIMWFRATSKSLNSHSISGYLALTIMTTHLIWAILAIRQWKRCAQLFSRWSIVAWLWWLVAFCTGIPNVMP